MQHKTLTIIGAGPGGYTAAFRAAQKGMKVTVIERGGLGGVCLQQGCIPVKALLHSAKMLTNARRAADFGIDCNVNGFDFASMIDRKDDIVALNERGIEALLHRHAITVIKGGATLLSPTHVEVECEDGSTLGIASDFMLIATGSSSILPQGIELDNKTIFDCEGALSLSELPESCIVLGGGVLGCEFASLLTDLDVEVTVVDMKESLMPAWDSDLTKLLARSFKRRGVSFELGAAVETVDKNDEEGVTVRLADGRELTAASCLVAIGRKPTLPALNLKGDELAINNVTGGIEVDSFMRTNFNNIYAAGDVTGIRMLAHVAAEQGIVAVENMAGGNTEMRYDAVPDCFWGSPEMASVGIDDTAAKEAGMDIAVAKYQYRSTGISHAIGEIEGFVKALINKDGDTVVGVHIAGHAAPELIGEAAVIVANGLTVNDLDTTIHAHPTLGEIVKEAILAARGRNIHG